MANLCCKLLPKRKCCIEFLHRFLTCNCTKFCIFHYNSSSVITVYLITLSVTDCMAVKDWMRLNNKSEKKWSCPNLRYYPCICLLGLRKDTWKVCHDSLCPSEIQISLLLNKRCLSESSQPVIVVNASMKEDERGDQGHTSASLLHQSATWHCAVNMQMFLQECFLNFMFRSVCDREQNKATYLHQVLHEAW
jgi:hypothetical protein